MSFCDDREGEFSNMKPLSDYLGKIGYLTMLLHRYLLARLDHALFAFQEVQH
jgi:hypothetical protein